VPYSRYSDHRHSRMFTRQKHSGTSLAGIHLRRKNGCPIIR